MIQDLGWVSLDFAHCNEGESKRLRQHDGAVRPPGKGGSFILVLVGPGSA
jgi:hypothetical protein